ncbi:MAG TPA: ATP-grasp domain-containing protein [Opitutales bacterium]|nr:ATP-grasp domain-containing protein [Opitutales bacterium]
MRLFITSAGRRVELMDAFRSAGAAIGEKVEILAGDSNPPMSPACRLADRAFPLPSCDDPDYAQALLRVCLSEGVRLVVPTIDTELAVLAAARDVFENNGIRVNVSSPECVALCRDKLATARALAACGIDAPRSAALEDESWKDWKGPLVVKPVSGSSSNGVRLVSGAAEAAAIAPFLKGPCLVQEALSGIEYTVNCYFSNEGALCCAVPHRRMATRSGEVSKAVTERVEVLLDEAKKLEKFPHPFSGVICFQAMLESGRARVFEINARFGGGYPLAHFSGARFTDWLCLESLGRRPDFVANWKAGVTMLRYDASLFFDKS